MTRTAANCLLLLAGALWGAGFVAQSTAMDDIGPFSFVAWRFVIATVVVAPFARREARAARASDVGPLPPGSLPRYVLIGATLFLGMATQQVGLLTTTVANSGFLTGLYVVFTPLFVVLLFGERPHAAVWPAALVALAGIALMSVGGGGPGRGLAPGDLLTVASAGFWALQIVLVARFVGGAGRPLLLSLVQFAVTATLASAAAAALETFDAPALVRAAPSVIYAGVVASGIAFTLQVVAQRRTGAPQAAILLSSEAPFAALFGFALLGERVAPAGLAGAALILAAVLAVELVPVLGRRISRASAARRTAAAPSSPPASPTPPGSPARPRPGPQGP